MSKKKKTKKKDYHKTHREIVEEWMQERIGGLLKKKKEEEEKVGLIIQFYAPKHQQERTYLRETIHNLQDVVLYISHLSSLYPNIYKPIVIKALNLLDVYEALKKRAEEIGIWFEIKKRFEQAEKEWRKYAEE